MNRKLNNLLNNGSSSPDDLLYIADKLHLDIDFIGSMYTLPPKKLTNGNYIILITPSIDVTSGHWVAFKVTKNKIEYYDSYGVPPPNIFTKERKVYYNTKQIQNLSQQHCGIYSLLFLKEGAGLADCFTIYNS